MDDIALLSEDDILEKICLGDIIVTEEHNGEIIDIYDIGDRAVIDYDDGTTYEVTAIEHIEDNRFDIYCSAYDGGFGKDGEYESGVSHIEFRVLLSYNY